MLENFIISRIRAEFPFVPNKEKDELLARLGQFLVQSDERKLFILRGYAGTGKTSVVSALVKALGKMHSPCVLLAPTGRAAKVLSRYSGQPAYTIHKFIYRQKQTGVESFSLSDNLRQNTLFIVDEASMLSGRRDNPTFGSGCLLDDLIRFVYNGRRCSLLILGDTAQLPPVGQIESPALNSDFMRGYGLEVSDFQLKEVARQQLDSGILSNATRLRDTLSNKCFISYKDQIHDAADVQHIGFHELGERLEESYRQVGDEETLIITRSNKRTNLHNQGIRAQILWHDGEVCNGDRIMVSKNNYHWTEEYENLEFLANGDMLEIERIRHEHEMYGFRFAQASLRSLDYDWEIDALLWLDTLLTDSPEQNYQLQRQLYQKIAEEDFPDIRNKRELAKKIQEHPYYNALQARFAYTVTCHKAQGGQWKHIYIDPGFQPEEDQLSDQDKQEQLRWLYTALTRATERVFVLGQGGTDAD